MEKSSYDRELRAIGQALEAQHIATFELKTQRPGYVVSGAPEKPGSMMAWLRRWRHKQWRRGPRTIEYLPQDINALEKKGQDRRGVPGRLPEFYNVSNILRTVGAYLDAKNARLIEIQKRPMTLTLLYQSTDGHPQFEDRTIASFYKIFMDLHGKRSRLDKR